MHGTYSAVATPSRRSAAITASRSSAGGELHDVDEPRAPVVRVVRAAAARPVDVLEQLAVARGRRAAQLEDAGRASRAARSRARPGRRPAVVAAEPHVVEPRAPSTTGPGCAGCSSSCHSSLGVRRDHSALARRHLLVRIEREDRRRPVRAERARRLYSAPSASHASSISASPCARRRSRAAGRARTDSRTCRPRRSPSSAP